MYAWLWEACGRKARDGPRAFYLLNVLTGETWEVAASFERLTALVSGLLSARLLSGEPTTNDDEFVAACKGLAAQDAPQLNLEAKIISYFLSPPPQQSMPGSVM
jgi:hypothetical protein